MYSLVPVEIRQATTDVVPVWTDLFAGITFSSVHVDEVQRVGPAQPVPQAYKASKMGSRDLTSI